MKRIRLFLIPVLLMAIAVDGMAQSATITPSSPLTELYLDTQSVVLVLESDTFNTSSLLPGDFDLENGPSGLTINSAIDEQPTSVRLTFNFTYADFDADCTDVIVAINPSVLKISTNTLRSNGITVHAGIESAYLTPDAPLEEYDLDNRSVTFTLVNDLFDELPIGDADFTLDNIPSGLTVESHTATETTLTINLDWDDTDNDIDTDFTNFRVTLTDESEMKITAADLQTSPAVTIFANTESASASPDQTLDEHNNLASRYVTVELTNEDFISSGFSGNRVNLVNPPPGVTKESVTRQNSKRIRVDLSYDGTDFDTDVTDFHISLDGNNLQRTLDNDTIFTNYMTVTAVDEQPSAYLTTNPTPLYEETLDGSHVIVNLEEETFTTDTISINEFDLVNEPEGVTLTGFLYVSNTQVQLTLSFDGSDFDVNIDDFRVDIDHLYLTRSTADLASANTTIEANFEPAVATFSPDATMEEYSLQNRSLYVEIEQDTFLTTGGPLTPPGNYFELENEPAGLVIESVYINNKNQATLNLDFTYSDFDVNITDFRVIVKSGNLLQHTDDVNTNDVTIYHYFENPVADAAEDARMIERTLDSRSVDITLTEEWFPDPGSLQASDFPLLGGPTGLEVDNITGASKYNVTLNLKFDDTDFDKPFDNFRIGILTSVLIQSDDTLKTNTMSIEPTHEPEITAVSIGDSAYKVGDVVTVTISLDVPADLDTMFTLVGGKLGENYTLGNLTRDFSDYSTYTATFTVPEDGEDFAADEDIPVSNLQLNDGAIFGNIWDTPISNPNDLLDANTPDVSSILMISSGFQKIGDKIFMVVSADDTSYTIDNSTQINGVSITDDNVNYTDNKNNTYTFNYTVKNGEQDVPVPGDLTAGFVFSDLAGNKNLPFTEISTNDVSIDANPPKVDSIRITSSDIILTIEDKLDISIYADGDNYTIVDESTFINEVEATEGNVSTSFVGGGLYTIRYEVEEGDAEKTPGNLPISIVMADEYGNETEDPITQDRLPVNNITTLTTRPTAQLAGTQQICLGDTAALNVTFTGTAPWEFTYTDGTLTETIDSITENPYYFNVIPGSATTYTYSITYVGDSTGNMNTGTGSAFVQVYELPVVHIVGLGSIYSIEETAIDLTGDPAHVTRGEFKGVGVNQYADLSYYFNPNEAGVKGDPGHRIYYIYEDINGCVNDTFQDVTVISASADIVFGPDPLQPDVRSMACWYEDDFIISAVNTADSIGYFITEPYYPGFLNNNGDNTATLNPSVIDWNTIKDDLGIKIIYNFRDELNTLLDETRNLPIEWFFSPKIDPIESEYCSNEPLISLDGNYNKSPFNTGEFTIVQGVGGSIAEGYTFNPATANLGKTWIIYTQQQTAECVLKDSVGITVYPSPIADFQILDTCIEKTGSRVNFENITNSTGLTMADTGWIWTFGDFFNDTSYSENPFHEYSVGGSRTVTLKATTIHGCTNTKEQVFTFGAKPEANFEWNTECFTGDDIEFTALDVSDDPVDLYSWRIYNPDGSLLHQESGSDLTKFYVNFPARDEYPVDFTVKTNRNCKDTYEDTILLRPYLYIKATQDPYFEDFEADPPGWYSSKDEINKWGSWTFDPVTAGTFPGNAASGDHAWYTVHAHKDSIEQSWVSSPCFNLKETRRPMIRMSIKRSMERDRDGAVLQYTTDNGHTWNNVGALDDGSINWFNSFRITPEPGGQAEGWTGNFTFKADKNWIIAKHELDALRQHPVVQFRIGYGSFGISDFVPNRGFAFDDIWIGERSRLVLLEHFTNADDELSMQSNTRVNDLVDENNMDIIDIKYHTGEPGPDKMYDDYPIGPSARSLYYGISTFPQSFMDGGGETGTYRYNYKGTNLDELDLFTRALTDPSFDITLDAMVSGGQVNVDVTVEALEDLPEASYTVHIAVIEKEISDASYTGGSGQTVFENVVRQMLPDAGGSIFTKSWTTGDRETVSASWSFENVLNEEMIYVVAFIQNRETKVVYQAETNDPDANATSIEPFMAAINENILVYPNPSTGRAYVAFGKPVEDRTELRVYNHAGVLVEIHRIEGGLNVYELNVADYKKGVYYIRVTDKQKTAGTAKLIVL